MLDEREQAESGGQDLDAANMRLSTDEKEFAQKVEARAEQAPTDYGSSDYMAAYDDDYQMSTVPAFTKAAQQTAQPTDRQTETETAQTKLAPQPTGQGAPKLG